MAVDVSKNTYAVKAVLKSGAAIDLTGAVLNLSWQDPADEIAQRATVELARAQTVQGEQLASLLPLLTVLVIYGNGQEVFRGVVWEWEHSSDAQNQSIKLSCYDHFIYAKNSEFFAFYPPGKSTKDIVADICEKNGMKLNYQYGSITHAKLKYDPMPVADMLKKTIDEARRKLTDMPVMLFEKQALIVRAKGKNTVLYTFEAKKNAISTSERLTLNGLVTRVSVLGKEDQAGRRKLEADVNGKLEYGNLQRYVYRDGNDTLDSAKKEAQKLLEEKGKPERLITMTAPDIPGLRKGDKIKAATGGLTGDFYVKGVTHNAVTRVMSMELERTEGGAV